MVKPAVHYVESDRLPDLSFTFEGVDLTTFSFIKLRVRREDGTILEIDATIDDAANGAGHFEFAAGDLTSGNHVMEIQTTRASDSKPETYPDDASIPFLVRERV